MLSVATNAVTTLMIAYKFWYVAVGDSPDPVAHREVILQDLPNIDREASRLEWTKESSSDHIDYSR